MGIDATNFDKLEQHKGPLRWSRVGLTADPASSAVPVQLLPKRCAATS